MQPHATLQSSCTLTCTMPRMGTGTSRNFPDLKAYGKGEKPSLRQSTILSNSMQDFCAIVQQEAQPRI